jgi:hypothetical protein
MQNAKCKTEKWTTGRPPSGSTRAIAVDAWADEAVVVGASDYLHIAIDDWTPV